jgi:hypothetical protein
MAEQRTQFLGQFSEPRLEAKSFAPRRGTRHPSKRGTPFFRGRYPLLQPNSSAAHINCCTPINFVLGGVSYDGRDMVPTLNGLPRFGDMLSEVEGPACRPLSGLCTWLDRPLVRAITTRTGRAKLDATAQLTCGQGSRPA